MSINVVFLAVNTQAILRIPVKQKMDKITTDMCRTSPIIVHRIRQHWCYEVAPIAVAVQRKQVIIQMDKCPAWIRHWHEIVDGQVVSIHDKIMACQMYTAVSIHCKTHWLVSFGFFFFFVLHWAFHFQQQFNMPNVYFLYFFFLFRSTAITSKWTEHRFTISCHLRKSLFTNVKCIIAAIATTEYGQSSCNTCTATVQCNENSNSSDANHWRRKCHRNWSIQYTPITSVHIVWTIYSSDKWEFEKRCTRNACLILIITSNRLNQNKFNSNHCQTQSSHDGANQTLFIQK